MGSPKSVTKPEHLVRLWCHESKRVFEDRLINAEDHSCFKRLLQRFVTDQFQMVWDDVVPQVDPGYSRPCSEAVVFNVCVCTADTSILQGVLRWRLTSAIIPRARLIKKILGPEHENAENLNSDFCHTQSSIQRYRATIRRVLQPRAHPCFRECILCHGTVHQRF